MSLSNLSMSPVLSPSGSPIFSLGGKNSWKTFVYKGFVVSLEWMRLGKQIRAVMCIWPTSNVFTGGAESGAWTITRNCISSFVGFNANDKSNGSASEHCLREAQQALPVLGKAINDKQALNALVDVVVEFAPELIMMPATPKSVKESLREEALWDMQTVDKNSGKVLSEVSV